MLTVVVVARAAVPGRVKTRLIGPLTPSGAADVHAAMLACVLARAGTWVAPPGRRDLVLALDQRPARLVGPLVDHAAVVFGPARVPPAASLLGWRVIDQGRGDLGRRIDHVWRAIGGGPALFLGADSPDVPGTALAGVPVALARAEAAVGRVPDGGYWALAGRRLYPDLLAGIDWGTPRVYHQTLEAGRRGGLKLVDLAPWFDVDNIGDLQALRRRLGVRPGRHPDAALDDLRRALDHVLTGQPP